MSPIMDPSWLAAALASYEADEPHIDTSPDPFEMTEYYPPRDLPLMPANPNDWHLPVGSINRERLY